jgi:hypothetical protein
VGHPALVQAEHGAKEREDQRPSLELPPRARGQIEAAADVMEVTVRQIFGDQHAIAIGRAEDAMEMAETSNIIWPRAAELLKYCDLRPRVV